MKENEASASRASDAAAEAMAAHGGRPSCGARFDPDPHEGRIRCELAAGHAAKWHCNEAAGYEWSGRVLWLLPRSATRAA